MTSIRILIALAALLFLIGCAAPDGRVEFLSAKTVKLKKQRKIFGYLRKPGGTGPFPALVLLHGCGGISKRDNLWIAKLNDWGYATLQVDSFTPRGIRRVCKPKNGQREAKLSTGIRARDAHGARIYLRSRPFIQGERIGVMGWSHGGMTVLRAVYGRARFPRLAEAPGGDFKAAVALYPWCSKRKKERYFSPLLILIGDADDWTPSPLCVELARRSREAGVPIDLVVYPGATHGFDYNRPSRKAFGHRLRYAPEAHRDAEARIRAFLAQYLPPPENR